MTVDLHFLFYSFTAVSVTLTIAFDFKIQKNIPTLDKVEWQNIKTTPDRRSTIYCAHLPVLISLLSLLPRNKNVRGRHSFIPPRNKAIRKSDRWVLFQNQRTYSREARFCKRPEHWLSMMELSAKRNWKLQVFYRFFAGKFFTCA